MSIQFDMHTDTLSALTNKTDLRHESLGQLVRDLARAADPLQAKFNGEGAAVFAQFHAHSDEIATDLNRALASVLQGIHGQDVAYVQGDQAIADSNRSAMGSISWDSARFSGH